MTQTGIPPMEPLAPIVDQMRDLAREEIPAPRTCKVHLWDDGTVDVKIYHGMGDDEFQVVRYERWTSEIVWEHLRGHKWRTTTFAGGETLQEREFEERDLRVLTTVEPPYK